MKLVVGLGNPGSAYQQNRHNIGMCAVQFWVSQKGERFVEKSAFKGLFAKFSFGQERVGVLLPLTYMNRSGEAVQKVMAFYKIPIENVVVLHDEVDIPQGTMRIKRGGGPGTHNGLRSIQSLGSGYLRIRLGIGMPEQMDLASYVLKNFSKEEQEHWEKQFPQVAKALEACIQGRESQAMNDYNRK